LKSCVLRVSAVVVVWSCLLAGLGIMFVTDDVVLEAPLRAAPLQGEWTPSAVIAPLPAEVSNGTEWYLDASGSTPSPNGTTIVSHSWQVLYRKDNTSTFVNAIRQKFIFSMLGLYVITLTVTDNVGLTDTAYTAVYSILDSDGDELPDWWEIVYFDTLGEGADGDSDGDGWTNLREYANDLDPTAKDPQPGLIHELKENWYYLVILAAAIIVAILLLMPVFRRKRKEEEKKKIKAAIEIEKALEED